MQRRTLNFKQIIFYKLFLNIITINLAPFYITYHKYYPSYFSPSQQRLTNLKNRLEKELEAEMELEGSLEEYVKSQEYVIFSLII